MYANLDAEAAVITVLISSPYLYEQCELYAEDFTHPTLRTVYEIIGELRDRNKEVDPVLIADRLGTVDAAFLQSVMRDDVTPQALMDYVESMLRARIKEDAEKYLIRAQALIRNGHDIPTTELKQRILAEGEHIRQVLPKARTLDDIANEMLGKVEEIMDNPNQTYGLSTGLTDPDKITYGLVEGEMTVVGGKPGSGKSALAAQIACHVAMHHQKKVDIFSMEMTAREYLLRMVFQQCGLDTRLLKTGQYKKHGTEHKAIVAMTQRIKDSPLTIIDTTPQTVATIRGTVAKDSEDGQLGLFVVDYNELVEEHGIKEEVARIKYIMRGMKNTSRKYKVPSIVLSAVSRGNEDNAQALRYAGDFEGDIVEILKVEKDRTDDYAEIGIVKHRNGQTTRIPMIFHAPTTTWRNFAQGA